MQLSGRPSVGIASSKCRVSPGSGEDPRRSRRRSAALPAPSPPFASPGRRPSQPVAIRTGGLPTRLPVPALRVIMPHEDREAIPTYTSFASRPGLAYPAAEKCPGLLSRTPFGIVAATLSAKVRGRVMGRSSNPGCLLAVFQLLGLTGGQPGTLPYRLRDDFLSPAELAFYREHSRFVSRK